MSKKFILYAYTFTSRADRVVWALNELNFEYEVIGLDPFDNAGGKNPALLQINPQGKVPALAHNGKLLTESLAIMEYLVALAKREDLVPTDLDDAYHFRRLIYYMATEVEPYLWTYDQSTRLNGVFYQWPEGANQSSKALVIKNIQWIYGVLDSSPYAVGQQFTLADIYICSVLRWVHTIGIAHPQGTIQYITRLEGRKGFPDNMRTFTQSPPNTSEKETRVPSR